MASTKFDDLDLEGKFLMTRLKETLSLYKKLLPDFTNQLTEDEVNGMRFTGILFIKGSGQTKEIERIIGKVSREILIDFLINLHRQIEPTPEEIVSAGIRLMGKEITRRISSKIDISDESNFD